MTVMKRPYDVEIRVTLSGLRGLVEHVGWDRLETELREIARERAGTDVAELTDWDGFVLGEGELHLRAMFPISRSADNAAEVMAARLALRGEEP